MRRQFLCGLIPVCVAIGFLSPLPLAAQVELTRGPYLQSVLTDQAEILWRTSSSSLGRVEVIADGGTTITKTAATETTIHHLRFTDLEPGILHRYTVFDDDTVLAEAEFRTAPLPGQGTVRFSVVGDSGEGEADQHNVTALVERFGPDVFLHTGDIQYLGPVDRVFFEEYAQIISHAPVYVTRGNHSFGQLDPIWPEMFSVPPANLELPACKPPLCDITQEPDEAAFFSIDCGDAHFVFLDSNRGFLRECSQQLDWLCRDLSDAKSRGMTWLIAVVHEHPFTTGTNDFRDGEIIPRPVRKLLPPIFDRFGVDLVLSGHDHNYQRSLPLRAVGKGDVGGVVSDTQKGPLFSSPTGTIYVVTGGGGAPHLYPIFPDRPERPLFHVAESVYHSVEMTVSKDIFEVRAVDTDQREIDRFTISKTSAALIRGDANFDGFINIADAIGTLLHLFREPQLACPDAANVVPEDPLGIADPVFLLQFLFRGSAEPADPFPECGFVPGLSPDDCPCTCGEECS